MADLVDMSGEPIEASEKLAFLNALRRLSKADQKEAWHHQMIYGQCWLRTKEDGSVTLLDPSLIFKVKPMSIWRKIRG